MIIIGYLFTYLYLLLILFIISFLNQKLKINSKITRKIAHICISFTWIIMYHYFEDTIHLIIPPITFIILNYISYKKDIFKGIENRESLGTIYYPISVFILTLITYLHPRFYFAYAIGLFCMSLADGLAPLIAWKIKSIKILKEKTLIGSSVVFLVSLAVVIFFNFYFKINYQIYKIVIIALVSAILELISFKDTDNLTVPIGVALISYLLGVI